MDSVLEIQNLRVYFHTIDGVKKVLEDVSLWVEEGELVGLVGETGCGKSVTAKTVLNSLPMPPAKIIQGEVLFFGDSLLGLKNSKRERMIRKGISYIPQDPMSSLNPVFTVGEQLVDLIKWQGKRRVNLLGYLMEGRHDTQKAKGRAMELLDKVEIPSPSEMLKKYPVELSGGMRQRVLIAMSLIGNPSLLIADEPTTALDVTIQKGILELMINRVLEEDLSVLYITHDLGVAKKLCDRIYVMYAGTIAEVGKNNEVLENPKHPYSCGLLSSIPKLTKESYKGIEGRIPDYIDPPSGCRFHPRCGPRKEICNKKVPQMQEIGHSHLVACHLYSLITQR